MVFSHCVDSDELMSSASEDDDYKDIAIDDDFSMEEHSQEENEADTSLKAHISFGQEEDACPICLNDLIEQQIGVPDNCKHVFCVDCILEWSKNSSSCPVDRIMFANVNMFEKPGGSFQRKLAIIRTGLIVEEDDLTYCEICGSPDNEDTLLLCDGCDHGFHCACLTPSLSDVPHGEWFCPSCRSLQQSTSDVHFSRNARFLGRTRATERVRAQVSEVRLRHSQRGDLGSQFDSIVDEILAHTGSRFQVIEPEPSQQSTRGHISIKRNISRSRSKKPKHGIVIKPSSRKKLKQRRTSSRKRCMKQGSWISAGNKSSVKPTLAHTTVKPLTVLGRDAELDECPPGDIEETPSYLVAQKHRQLSRSALRFNTPLPSIMTLGNRMDAMQRLTSLPPEPVSDLLGSILSGQELLLTPSRSISIRTSGTLFVNGLCNQRQSGIEEKMQSCIQINCVVDKDIKLMQSEEKPHLNSDSECGRKTANNHDKNSSGKPTSSQNNPSSANSVSSSQNQSGQPYGSSVQLTLNLDQSTSYSGANNALNISNNQVHSLDLKPSNKKKFNLKRFNLISKKSKPVSSSGGMKSGRKIQIKKVLNLPHDAKEERKKEDVYDPFDPTGDDDLDTSLSISGVKEEIYDPFQPTLSDEEKQVSDVEITPFRIFPKFLNQSEEALGQNNKSEMEVKKPGCDVEKSTSEAASEVTNTLFTDIELDELLDSNLDAAVSDKNDGLKEEETKSKTVKSPELDMFAEPEPTLEESVPSSTWRSKIRSISSVHGSGIIKLPEFQSGEENAQPVYFKKVKKNKSMEMIHDEAQDKASDKLDIKELDASCAKSPDNIAANKEKVEERIQTTECVNVASDAHLYESKSRSHSEHSIKGSRSLKSRSHNSSKKNRGPHHGSRSRSRTRCETDWQKSTQDERSHSSHRWSRRSVSRSSHKRQRPVSSMSPRKISCRNITKDKSSKKSKTLSRYDFCEGEGKTWRQRKDKSRLSDIEVAKKSTKVKSGDKVDILEVSGKHKSKKHKKNKYEANEKAASALDGDVGKDVSFVDKLNLETVNEHGCKIKTSSKNRMREYKPMKEHSGGKKKSKSRSSKPQCHKEELTISTVFRSNFSAYEERTDGGDTKCGKKSRKKKKKTKHVQKESKSSQGDKFSSKMDSRKRSEFSSPVKWIEPEKNEKHRHNDDDQEQWYPKGNQLTGKRKIHGKSITVHTASDNDEPVFSADDIATQDASSEPKLHKKKSKMYRLSIVNEQEKLSGKNKKKLNSEQENKYDVHKESDSESRRKHKGKKRKSQGTSNVILIEDHADISELSFKKKRRKKEKLQKKSEDEITVEYKKRKTSQMDEIVEKSDYDRIWGHKRKKHSKIRHTESTCSSDEIMTEHQHHKLHGCMSKDDEKTEQDAKTATRKNKSVPFFEKEKHQREDKKHYCDIHDSEMKHAELTRMLSSQELENNCLSPLRTPTPMKLYELAQSQQKEKIQVRMKVDGDDQVEGIFSEKFTTISCLPSDGNEMYSPSAALLENDDGVRTLELIASKSVLADKSNKTEMSTADDIYSPSSAVDDQNILKDFRSPSPLSPSSLSPNVNSQPPSSSQEIMETPSIAEEFLEQSRKRWEERKKEKREVSVANQIMTDKNANNKEAPAKLGNSSFSGKRIMNIALFSSTPAVQKEEGNGFQELTSRSPCISVSEDMFADSPVPVVESNGRIESYLPASVQPEQEKKRLHVDSIRTEMLKKSIPFSVPLQSIGQVPFSPKLIVDLPDPWKYNLATADTKLRKEKEERFARDVDEREKHVERHTPDTKHSSKTELRSASRHGSRSKKHEKERKNSKSPKKQRSSKARDSKGRKHMVRKRSRTKSPPKDSRDRKLSSRSRRRGAQPHVLQKRSLQRSRNQIDSRARSPSNTDRPRSPISAFQSAAIIFKKHKVLPVEDAGPHPISTISGLSSSANHHAMQDHLDMTEDEFIPDNLIPKANQESALRTLVEVPTVTIKATDVKPSNVAQVLARPSSAIGYVKNLPLSEESNDEVLKTENIFTTTVSGDEKSKLGKIKIIAPSTPQPLTISPQANLEEKGILGLFSDTSLLEKDAYSPSDELPSEERKPAVLQPKFNVNPPAENQVLNPTQILNFIGLNPQQKSAAQNAILSIAELSKHLQLDKFIKSDKKPVTKDEDGLSPVSMDNIESSAVEMYNKGKESGLQKRVQFQDRVVEEAKLAIKPYYERREINKAEYKEIMKRAVNKICTSENNMEINNVKIRRLIRRYIEKYQQKNAFKKEKMRSKLDEKIENKPSSPSRPPYEPLTPPHQGVKLDTDGLKLDTPSLLKREPRKIVTLPDLPLPPPPPPPRPSYLP